MPQPTGVRALQRSLGLPTLTKKAQQQRSDTEKYRDIYSPRHQTKPISTAGTMERLTSKDVRRSLHLSGRSSSPSKKLPKSSPKLQPSKPAQLVVLIESPPLVFHGTPASSTGALLSGLLRLVVTEPEIKIQRYVMTLQARITTRKPVSKDCPQCITRTSDLHTWTFLSEPTPFKQGTQTFPFSFLLPGNLPATSQGELGRMEYVLSAKATTSLDEILAIEYPLIVQRALMPGSDRNSERIFPPTNLRAHIITPAVIHPTGSFPVQMRLTGLVDNGCKDVQKRWRVRKMNWRIEEHSHVVSAACAKHAHKVGGEGKGILTDSDRTVGSDEIKLGWKTDLETPGGQVEMEFKAQIDGNRHPICDVESSNGLSASHTLVLEIIVAEEQVATKGNRYPTPTGGARILRMQFKLIVTERAGQGVSWDEEMPPMYEDVERSPPGYMRMEAFEGELSELDLDEEIEGMGHLQIASSASAGSAPEYSPT